MGDPWNDESTWATFAEEEGRARSLATEARVREGDAEQILEESLAAARALERSGLSRCARVLLLGTAVRLERAGAVDAGNRLLGAMSEVCVRTCGSRGS
ncbi:MAG: hypothetical protein HYV07_12465 [Deltaproteobacteria bacterium]|nr:hypothetical protein [Deltaproteobacteria bacterium]